MVHDLDLAHITWVRWIRLDLCAYTYHKRVKRPFRLGPDSPNLTTPVSASIVIPARNEANNIEACLLSCVAQDLQELQVVVLDDASSDGTGEIIQRLSDLYPTITALKGDGAPLPEGWYGKPWACQRAQSKATGEWLLFIDADVVIAREALSRAIAYAKENALDMVTGIGEMVMLSFWEKTLQPAVGGMILAGNSLRKVNDHERKDNNLANGQFILISREAYDAIGGHQSVQNNIIDDIGIARALVEKDLKYHCLDLHDLFKCRMYTSFGEIWEGWTNFICRFKILLDQCLDCHRSDIGFFSCWSCALYCLGRRTS